VAKSFKRFLSSEKKIRKESPPKGIVKKHAQPLQSVSKEKENWEKKRGGKSYWCVNNQQGVCREGSNGGEIRHYKSKRDKKAGHASYHRVKKLLVLRR